MNGLTKILIGAGATALMAWGNHALGSGGEIFVGELKTQAESAVAGADVIGESPQISFTGGDPNNPLSRFATLSGTFPDEVRAAMLNSVRAIPGVSGAAWDDGFTGEMAAAADDAGETTDMAGSDGSNGDEAPATAEAVSDCQSKVDAIIASETITFKSGSTYVNPSNYDLLDKLAETLKPCSGTVVEISGHTNTVGSAGVNTRLSQGRAEAVMEELTKRGVPAERLTAKGYGPERLKNTANGAAPENRRIEFAVSAGEARPAATDSEDEAAAKQITPTDAPADKGAE